MPPNTPPSNPSNLLASALAAAMRNKEGVSSSATSPGDMAYLNLLKASEYSDAIHDNDRALREIVTRIFQCIDLNAFFEKRAIVALPGKLSEVQRLIAEGNIRDHALDLDREDLAAVLTPWEIEKLLNGGG